MYVNDRFKYVVCLPLKAGCTTWKTILVNNTLEEPLPSSFDSEKLHINGLIPYKINRLNSYSKKDQEKILESYFKFLVVRHPLDRLVSAYIDKIIKRDYLSVKHAIVKQQMKKYNKESYSFQAFLEYMLSTENSLDPHWSPAAEMCDPCNVNYDKIIKLETQAEDLMSVLPHLGPYERGNSVHANAKGAGAATDFTRQLNEFRNVSESLFHRILSLGFDRDLELFGYNWSNNTSNFEVSCSESALYCC